MKNAQLVIILFSKLWHSNVRSCPGQHDSRLKSLHSHIHSSRLWSSSPSSSDVQGPPQLRWSRKSVRCEGGCLRTACHCSRDRGASFAHPVKDAADARNRRKDPFTKTRCHWWPGNTWAIASIASPLYCNRAAEVT